MQDTVIIWYLAIGSSLITVILFSYFYMKRSKRKIMDEKSLAMIKHFNGWWENEINVKMKKDKVMKTDKILDTIADFDASDAKN